MSATAYERHAPAPSLVSRSLASSEQRVFWSDDVPHQPSFTPLTASLRADLVVVGGGYCGLWTAITAKRRNPALHVVLLESQTVGWAASGRNGGFCDASLTHGEANGRTRWPDEYDLLDRLGRQNLDGFEQDMDELGIDAQFERTGMFTAAVEDHELPWLDELSGVRLDDMGARLEIDSPLFLGAVWDRAETALVHPARLAAGLAVAAARLGVEIFEHSRVTDIDAGRGGPVAVSTDRVVIDARQVALATNVFPSPLKRLRPFTVPVYDYVLMTEPLSAGQMASIGWTKRQGLGDLANQFHYSRLTADNRILWGGYDAIHTRDVSPAHEDRPETFRKLASHFLATFPQLEDVRFSHRWAGPIDTCTRFAAFHGLTAGGRIAYAAGFTGLGVGATRFAAEVMIDRLSGERTERTENSMVQKLPIPFPPEPAKSLGIELTRRGLDRADHRAGVRGPWVRALDALGLGFDS